MKLIFGCGYLGLRVAKLWLSEANTVSAVTRSQQRADLLANSGISPIVADIMHPETLTELPEAETVLFAVGFDRTSGKTIGQVYAEGLANVLAALPAATVRVIYISSTGVYGQNEGEEVDEESPCQPTREGGQAALAAERVLRSSRFASQSSILRLAGIYGPDRVPHAKALLTGHSISSPADGFLNLIHVDDAARAVIAAECSAAAGRTYCVSDGHPTVRRAYYAEMARLLNTRPPVYDESGTGHTPRSRGGGSKRVRNRRLLEELDVSPKYPSYREGLAEILGSAQNLDQ
ncbi:MAG: SDR family oxidoreductase [Planctomycetales bacterium]|nr:SDR family oxidoreductase [Planctomycetales bacterium]